MKKLLLLLVCAVICLSFCACNKEEPVESVIESTVPSASSSKESAPQGLNSIVAPKEMNDKKYPCNVASSDGLILRIGPSTEYDAIGVIEDGTAITELANENGWVYVDVQGQQGWVFGQYVEYREN